MEKKKRTKVRQREGQFLRLETDMPAGTANDPGRDLANWCTEPREVFGLRPYSGGPAVRGPAARDLFGL